MSLFFFLLIMIMVTSSIGLRIGINLAEESLADYNTALAAGMLDAEKASDWVTDGGLLFEKWFV